MELTVDYRAKAKEQIAAMRPDEKKLVREKLRRNSEVLLSIMSKMEGKLPQIACRPILNVFRPKDRLLINQMLDEFKELVGFEIDDANHFIYLFYLLNELIKEQAENAVH